MVEREGTSRSITLEELAAIAGALDAGMPRDEVLAGAGLSAEAWEAAQERWLSRLAAQAARGQLRSSQRYLELVAEQRRRAQVKVQALRRKLEGPIPVAPAAHLSPLQDARRDRATPLPAAEARSEAAAGSPWARGQSSGQDAARPSAVERAGTPEAASQDTTASSTVSPLAARNALPFARQTPPPAADAALPFARQTPSPPADSALPFARPTPPPVADAALPFARPTSSPPPADSALPFARPTSSPPPADSALPFARQTPPSAADAALPFARPAPPPPADSALPFARPTPSPPATDTALPFARSAPPSEVSPLSMNKTMALPSRPSTGSWALPFQPPGAAGGPPADASGAQPAAPAPAGADAELMESVHRITLAQYVHLCARARESPDHVPVLQQQYGLNPMSWTTLHQVWGERFQRNPALRARWQALLDEHTRR
ncbi:hypothetical protein SOCE26_035960 [Sorangium cellulosum]|uniref:Uncharacterized protein n=1 Tax=Sorangium cellulosum TaxID=56 RepID=A0A2L0ESA1_SORCE|nr:hypothetical protein [Sorangium cellulosum]AUX42169.1 hypothetical protein SOCE26_035960 [Sorangium cellulosum]